LIQNVERLISNGSTGLDGSEGSFRWGCNKRFDTINSLLDELGHGASQTIDSEVGKSSEFSCSKNGLGSREPSNAAASIRHERSIGIFDFYERRVVPTQVFLSVYPAPTHTVQFKGRRAHQTEDAIGDRSRRLIPLESTRMSLSWRDHTSWPTENQAGPSR
jgi:hypothetical protein